MTYDISVDYWQEYQYECKIKDEFIQEEMNKFREEAISKIAHAISHPKIFPINELALTLAYAYFESYEESEKVFDALDLNRIDFLAINEAFDGFKEEYLKYYDEAQNF